MAPLRSRSSFITIQVGRMGAGMDNIKVSKDSNIKEILKENGYVVGENESVHFNGDKISKSDLKSTKPTKNSVIVLVGAKEGGLR